MLLQGFSKLKDHPQAFANPPMSSIVCGEQNWIFPGKRKGGRREGEGGRGRGVTVVPNGIKFPTLMGFQIHTRRMGFLSPMLLGKVVA